jgi:hypothetical protein
MEFVLILLKQQSKLQYFLMSYVIGRLPHLQLASCTSMQSNLFLREKLPQLLVQRTNDRQNGNQNS